MGLKYLAWVDPNIYGWYPMGLKYLAWVDRAITGGIPGAKEKPSMGRSQKLLITYWSAWGPGIVRMEGWVVNEEVNDEGTNERKDKKK